MDDFQGTERVLLQPTSADVARSFTFSVCSSATANDGFLPYGATIASVAVVAYDKDGTVCTSELIEGTPSLSDFTVTVLFDYPSTTGPGRYKITISATLGDASVEEADFDRIVAKDN